MNGSPDCPSAKANGALQSREKAAIISLHTKFETLKGLYLWYLYREMPTMNLEKIYTSPYRSFNFQQLFFYDIFLRNAYFTSYR